MSVDAGTAVLQIKPDFDGVGRQVESEGRSVFSGMGKNLALAFAGGFVVDKAVDFFKGAISEAREAQKVGAETAQILKVTGASAWTSRDKIEGLATSISNLTGVDDEAIQHTENLLLTFGNIRDLGGNKDIFSRATGLAQDMAATMGGDAAGAANLLGKALSDPIRGMAGLRRANVTFLPEQEKTIKAMAEAGDTAGAQAALLDAVASQLGGVAAAQADPIQKLNVLWGNVKEQVGTALMPVLNRVVEWAATLLPKAVEIGAKAWAFLSEGFHGFIEAFKGEGVTSDGFVGFMERVGVIARDLFDFIVSHKDEVVGAIAAIFGVWAAQATIAAAATIIAALPFYAIVAAIAAVGAALVYAYQNWTGFREVVDKVVAWLKENVPPAFEKVKEAIKTAIQWINDNVVPVVKRVAADIVEQFNHVKAWVEENWPKISEAIGHVLVAIQTAVAMWVGPLVFIWQHAHDQILAITSEVWSLIRAYVETAITIVKNTIELVLNIINGDWSAAWQNIQNILAAQWTFMGALISGALTIIKNVISGALSTVFSLWTAEWSAIGSFLAAAWSSMVSAVSSGVASVVGFFIALPGRIGGALAGLAGLMMAKGIEALMALLNGAVNMSTAVFNWFTSLPGRVVSTVGNLGRALYDKGVQLIQGFIDGIKDKATEIPGVVAGAVKALSPAGHILSHIPGFAAGGIIDSPMIAQLHSNEVVIPLSNPSRAAELVRMSGLDSLLGLNSVSPAYAPSSPHAGGPVVNISGDVRIGSDDLVSDLDWYAATRFAGV